MVDRRRKVQTVALLCAALVAVTISACGGGSSSNANNSTASAAGGGGATDQKLTVAVGADLGTVDPVALTSDSGINGLYEVVQTLTTVYDSGGKLQPLLATAWKGSNDGKTWTFTLRTGVKFSDGTPFDAAAVKASIDRVTDPKIASPLLQSLGVIKKTVVVDPTHVRFELSRPFGYLPAVMASSAAAIISPASMTKSGNTYKLIKDPVGTGPYTFQSYTPNQQVVLQRNPNYWGTPSPFAMITMKIIPEAATQVAQLRSGGVDLISGAPSSDIENLQHTSGLAVTTAPSRRFVYYSLNTQDRQQKLLHNPQVRQALNYAVDTKTIISKVLFGQADPVSSPIPAVMDSGCTSPAYSYNPAKAKQLLQQAGATGMTLQMRSSTGRFPEDFQSAQAVAGYLKAVGINVQGPTTSDYPTYIAGVLKPPAQSQSGASIVGLAAIYPDPGAAMSYFNSELIPPEGFNTAYYDSPPVDKLLDSADALTDRTKANAVYCRAAAKVWADAPWMFLWTLKTVVVHKDSLSNIVLTPNQMVVYDDIKPVK